MATNFSLSVVGTPTTLITAGAGSTAVLSIIFCNTDTTTRKIYLKCTPSGGTSRFVLTEVPVTAGNTFIWTANEKFILATGDTLTAYSDVASKIDATVSFYVL